MTLRKPLRLLHSCRPTASLGYRHAHQVPAERLWHCADCGRRWRKTSRHIGRVCGCGWVLVENEISLEGET